MRNRKRSALGVLVKDAREAKGLSQREVGFIAGLAHVTIGDIERGKKNSDPAVLTRIARAIDLEPKVLITASNRFRAEKLRRRLAELERAS